MTAAERILIVEDEAHVRSLVRRAFEAQGYEVLDAGDAEQALERMAGIAGRLHAAVIDVTLPGMDGPTLARRLRETQPALSVLLISGYGDPKQREELDEHLMAKPFDFDALISCVRELIDTGTCKACAPVQLQTHRNAELSPKEER